MLLSRKVMPGVDRNPTGQPPVLIVRRAAVLPAVRLSWVFKSARQRDEADYCAVACPPDTGEEMETGRLLNG